MNRTCTDCGMQFLRGYGVFDNPATFRVQGVPRSSQTGKTIRVGRQAFRLRENSAWIRSFGIQAKGNYRGPCHDGPVRVEFRLLADGVEVSVIPADGRPARPTEPDLDNSVKGLLDALQGICYRNDRQITTLVVSRA